MEIYYIYSCDSLFLSNMIILKIDFFSYFVNLSLIIILKGI